MNVVKVFTGVDEQEIQDNINRSIRSNPELEIDKISSNVIPLANGDASWYIVWIVFKTVEVQQ